MNDKIVEIIVRGLQETKAKDIRIVDMTDIEEAAASYFVICEGSSSTHVYGIADELMDYVKDAIGQKAFGSIGMQSRQWIVVDYGHVLVHVFQPEARQFYRLESLWADAPLTIV